MKIRKILIALTILLSVTVLNSCQKSIDDTDIVYIGSWGSDKFALEIWKNGRGVIQKKNQVSTEGRVEITSSQIQFRGGKFKNFEIDASPSTDVNGNIIMVLDGEIFYKH